MQPTQRTKPPKRTTAQAIRARLKAQRQLAAQHANTVLERESASRIERFVELADQLRQEDAELTEK
ncbi:hypothetical protein O9X98_04955 [Agrobacterium salinitolerans]|nr:hypothetical protein [Agrobacterium salinitolerans]